MFSFCSYLFLYGVFLCLSFTIVCLYIEALFPFHCLRRVRYGKSYRNSVSCKKTFSSSQVFRFCSVYCMPNIIVIFNNKFILVYLLVKIKQRLLIPKLLHFMSFLQQILKVVHFYEITKLLFERTTLILFMSFILYIPRLLLFSKNNNESFQK